MNAAAADRLMQQAAEQYNAGRRNSAESICREILAARPDFIPALHLAAVVALAGDRMSEGTNLLSQLFMRDPDYLPALVTMGDALSVKGEQEAAAAVFKRVARSCSGDASVHVKLAGALAELSKFAEAECAYRRAIELDPNMLHAAVSPRKAADLDERSNPSQRGIGANGCKFAAASASHSRLR